MPDQVAPEPFDPENLREAILRLFEHPEKRQKEAAQNG
jgi:hypothetical protein